MQKAIDRAVEITHESILRLEAAEQALLKRYSADPKVRADLVKFIDGAKYACTANLNWR